MSKLPILSKRSTLPTGDNGTPPTSPTICAPVLSAVVNVTGRLVSCAELDSRRALTAVFDTSVQRPESPFGGIWDRMQHESPPRPVTTALRSDQACPAAGRPWEQRTVPWSQFVAHWCTIVVSVAVRLLMHPRCRQVTALLVSDACDVLNEFCGAWRCPGTR